MNLIIYACILTFLGCKNYEEGYSVIVETQPEYVLTPYSAEGSSMLYVLSPQIMAVDKFGNKYYLSPKNNQLQEGYIYKLELKAKPYPVGAQDVTTRYSYSITNIIDKKYVGLNESYTHTTTLKLHYCLDEANFEYYQATNVETGEIDMFCIGEIIGLGKNGKGSLTEDCTVKVKVYPQGKRTNPYNEHTSLYRLEEILSEDAQK